MQGMGIIDGMYVRFHALKSSHTNISFFLRLLIKLMIPPSFIPFTEGWDLYIRPQQVTSTGFCIEDGEGRREIYRCPLIKNSTKWVSLYRWTSLSYHRHLSLHPAPPRHAKPRHAKPCPYLYPEPWSSIHALLYPAIPPSL